VKSEAPSGARAVRTEWAQWDLTTESWQAAQRVTVEEYRRDGKLASSEIRFGDGPVSRSGNSHDEAGVLTESWFQNGDGPAGRVLCSYDGLGRLIHQVQRAPDGTERVAEQRVYAADGSHTCILHLPKMEGATAVYCPIEGVDYYCSAPGTTTVTTVYSKEGHSSEVLLKDADGAVLRRFVLTRDEFGRLVKDELLLGALPLAPDVPLFGAGATLMTSEYKYDEQGRRVEVVRRMFGVSEDRETVSYDDRGNRTETTTEEQQREANMNEGNLEYGAATVNRRQSRMAYRYDARGNWLERVTSQRYGENPDFTPCSIERREIAYYE
jgi:hypothetical protein